MLIGILADSHGGVAQLREGIRELRRRNADMLIHLGDMTDTLKPETTNECAEILVRNKVGGVLGNHEYSLVMHHFKRYPERFSESTRKYVSSLPRTIEIQDVCFTHFSPDGGVYGLFASTDEDSYAETLRNSRWRILINGHSHDPRIYCQSNGIIKNVALRVGRPFRLAEGDRYILTCGALEDWYCALFALEPEIFEVVRITR